MRRRFLQAAFLVAGAGLVALAVSHAAARGSEAAAGGGTLRVTIGQAGFGSIDPAFALTDPIVDVTCARLLNYPDKPPPAGYRITPEVATALPKVSNGGRTFTFTLRKTFRFSDGKPVRADAFAHAIDRALILARADPGAGFYFDDIVGAKAVMKGTADHASGVTASGTKLVVRLTAPAPSFLPRLTTTPFCAVPPDLITDPEGVTAFAGSGPYYFSEYVRGKRAVLKRNPHYRGTRPHRLDSIVVDLFGDPREGFKLVERGEADWALGPPFLYWDTALGLQRKYGTGKSRRFLVYPAVSTGLAVNVSRPLFRDNLALRRALNYAIDRPRLTAFFHGRPADHYLPADMPGYRNAQLYPLNGPDLGTARALATGNTRSGKAVLWIPDLPEFVALGQVVKQDLRKIGLDVQVKPIPGPAFYDRIGKPGAPFDLAAVTWIGAFPDPYEFMNSLFDSRSIGAANIGRFRSAKYDRLLRRTATLSGEARYRAYGDLDVQLARDAAPRIQIAWEGVATFVSSRVGCIVLRPQLDLAAACLK